MADNQQSGSQGKDPAVNQGASQKPTTLSWSQHQQSSTAAKPTQPVRTTQTTPAQTTSRNTVVIAFFVGLIIGLLVTWSWFGLRHSSGNTTSVAGNLNGADGSALSVTQTGGNSSPTTASASDSKTSGNSSGDAMAAGTQSSDTVTVPSPQNAGTTVTVSNVTTSQGAWAVVYEDTNGAPGRILGAARFWPERHSGTIELLRATLPNLNYYVGLVADTPDHSFGVHTNTPLTGENGKQILTQFTAQ